MEQRKIDRQADEAPEYARPEVSDYGDLQELTATHAPAPVTDVPFGAPVQVGFS